ncbi:protein of unknown function [Nitrosovibrio sp. Nv17]|nr:protein of unknown function [Nitrosovibrio sp. Nv17]
MPCCAKPDSLRRLLRGAVVLGGLMLSLGAPVHAEGIQVKSIAIGSADEGYRFDADFEITLNSKLERALEKGIVLYFVTELNLVNFRWYWLNQRVAHSRVREGLSYYALTRQYRLSRGGLSQNFNTIEEALQVLGRVRDRPILASAELAPDRDYILELRMWLDISALPKPFQVETLGTREWDLGTGVLRWGTKLPVPGLQDRAAP